MKSMEKSVNGVWIEVTFETISDFWVKQIFQKPGFDTRLV